MRIIVNCRSILLNTRTGIGRYTYHLLDQLGAIDPSTQYFLYAQKRLLDFKRRLPQFKHRYLINAIDSFKRPIPKGDIYHLPSPCDLESFDGKVVVTVHDLISKTFPQSHTPETNIIMERQMQAIVRRADMIICVSENTRHDLHQYYQMDHEKTTVVLSGVDHDIFYVMSDLSQANEFLTSRGIVNDFVLFVGTIEPRKNLQTLLEAMALLKKDMPLVVVGMKGWMTEHISSHIDRLGLRHRVIFLGYVSDTELNMLYNSCTVFVFPSLYEGFGFPIVEAFSAGACVITSTLSSCKEIAKDAALIIDPKSPSSIAQAIESIATDKALRTAYKAKGLRRSQDFSFKAMAQNTLNVYKSLLNLY